jgi:uncharacterized membrane protein
VTWLAIAVASVGCYLLKLAGLSVPSWVLDHPLVARVADLIPVALLSALVAVQVFASGSALVLDARVAGLAFATLALLLRAPFLVVVFGAAAVAALVRMVGAGTAVPGREAPGRARREGPSVRRCPRGRRAPRRDWWPPGDGPPAPCRRTPWPPC